MRAVTLVLFSSLVSSSMACGDSPSPADASPLVDGSLLVDGRPSGGTGFLLPVHDVFRITGRGVVAVGEIERGTVSVGDALDLVGLRPDQRVTVNAVEVDNTPVDRPAVGQTVSVYIDGVDRQDIEPGQVLAAVDSIDAHTRLRADITLLTFAAGGRADPLPDGYRAQVYFFVSDTDATIDLPGDSLAPGASARIDAELALPMAVEPGFEFLLRDGGRTIGSGAVVELTD
jgi:translation elongation factor TU